MPPGGPLLELLLILLELLLLVTITDFESDIGDLYRLLVDSSFLVLLLLLTGVLSESFLIMRGDLDRPNGGLYTTSSRGAAGGFASTSFGKDGYLTTVVDYLVALL